MYPSSIVFAFSGFIILYVILSVIYNRRTSINTIELIKISQFNVFLLTLAIALGVHGLGHAYAEVNFGFNPLEGKWDYRLKK